METKTYTFEEFVKRAVVTPIITFLDGTIEEETIKVLNDKQLRADALAKFIKMAPGICSGKGWTLVQVDDNGLVYAEGVAKGLPNF